MSKYQICISGSAGGGAVEVAHQLAYALGKAVGESGHTLITGATVGLPQYAAQGAKEAGGFSVGFSPAGSYREHITMYKLPTAEFDYINYTGLDYVGRDVYLVRSSDAVITIGGRMGSLHEFATATESHKVCGVLLGSGGLADFIPTLVKKVLNAHASAIIYDTDPARLVKNVIAALDEKYEGLDELPVSEDPTRGHKG